MRRSIESEKENYEMSINGVNSRIGKINDLNASEEFAFRTTQLSSPTMEIEADSPSKLGDQKLYGSYPRRQVETCLANQQTVAIDELSFQDKNTLKTQQEKSVEPQVADVRLREIDSQLTAKFTDTGIVRSASSVRESLVDPKTGEKIDGHYQFGKKGDFKIHTIHIYGDEQ